VPPHTSWEAVFTPTGRGGETDASLRGNGALSRGMWLLLVLGNMERGKSGTLLS
jgi:hypothetical protein